MPNLQLDFLDHQMKRRPTSGLLNWAIGPFAPQRCTPNLIEGCADLADAHDLEFTYIPMKLGLRY